MILKTYCIIILIWVSLLTIFSDYTFGQTDKITQITHAVIYENGKAYLDNTPDMDYIFENYPVQKENKNQLTENLYTLSLNANFKMLYVWIYSETGLDTLFLVDSTFFSSEIPPGMYSIFTGYYPSAHRHSIIVKDSILLNTSIGIQIYKEEAIYTANYRFSRETGETMRINAIGFYFFNNLNDSRLRITGEAIDSIAYLFSFNKIPAYFNGEWCVKGKQNRNGGNLYLLNNELPLEEKDTVVTNVPVHLAPADFYYHVPDSIETQQRDVQIFTHQPEFHTWGPGDPFYQAPVHMRIFQDTTADFPLITSTFFQVLHAWPGITYITTPEIKIGSQAVKGFFYRDRHATSFVISENIEKVHWGLTPTYWFGKFFNKNDSIKIGSPYGYWTQLFLAQGNDVLAHYPIDYILYNNGIQVRNGQFIPTTYGYPHMLFGFHPDSLNIPVTAGRYRIIITDKQNQVAGYTGISQVTAEFDLNQPDKNPPNITLFQILKNDELANLLDSAQSNYIRFILEDNEVINQVQLFYAVLNDSIWHELPLAYNTPYWKTQIPGLTEGFYSLKLFATDMQGNYINCQMSPAFRMQAATSLPGGRAENLSEKFQLFQNYPNPFNAGTVILYKISEYFKGKIEISISNVVGQKVRTLYSDHTLPGIHKLPWDGKDNNGKQLSSGIYIMELKGGDIVLRNKLLIVK